MKNERMPWDLGTHTAVSCSDEFWALIDANWSVAEQKALTVEWVWIAGICDVTD